MFRGKDLGHRKKQKTTNTETALPMTIKFFTVVLFAAFTGVAALQVSGPQPSLFAEAPVVYPN